MLLYSFEQVYSGGSSSIGRDGWVLDDEREGQSCRDGLSFFRRNSLERGDESVMGDEIDWPVFDGGTRRVLAKIVIRFPILRRSDWSRHEAAATVRTDIVQDVFNACSAERAFIGTDACLR